MSGCVPGLAGLTHPIGRTGMGLRQVRKGHCSCQDTRWNKVGWPVDTPVCATSGTGRGSDGERLKLLGEPKTFGPCTCTGDPEDAPNYQLVIGSVPAIVATLRVN